MPRRRRRLPRPRLRRPGRPKKYRMLAERAIELDPEAARGALGIFLLILGIFLLLCVTGIAGNFGQLIKKFTQILIGYSTFILPLFFLGIAWQLLRPLKEKEEPRIRLSTFFGLIIFFASFSGLVHLFVVPDVSLVVAKAGLGGGYLGYGVSKIFLNAMDFWASFILLLGLMALSLVFVLNISWAQLVDFSKVLVSGAVPEGEKVEIKGEKGPGIWEKFIGLFKKPKEEKPSPPATPPPSPAGWVLPPLELLEDKVTKPSSGDIEGNVKAIKKCLANFSIEVTMGEVNIGPTVTQYTLKPATGVKLNQITARANDIALSLAAHPIRIEAPIPGRSAVGIEVPNKVPALVRLREMLSTTEFNNLKSKLGFMLGRDVAGKPVSADLEKMPHLLIAGATGSGKSICINNIILTFLYRNSPSDLKFLLVDPKRVELVAYNGIPHLITPVVTDLEKTINALRWAVSEMERRYSIFSETNKRNIEIYNASAKEKMPYLVVIVDELADLMAMAAREVEGSIVRLAQLARATGIHLIVATQRPSVDVITGLIKANITSRIAFAVASQVDSRTILDMAGAEKLLGNGDMLYMASDVGRPKRIQGIYVSDKEIKAVSEFLKSHGEAHYDESVIEYQGKGTGYFGEKAPEDELFDEAVEVVARAKKASASLLQRRLRIGYARAARLLDLLEERGIIGPADGARPRDVLIDETGGRYRFEDH